MHRSNKLQHPIVLKRYASANITRLFVIFRHFFAPGFIVLVPLRVLREPAAQHALFLKEHFVDAPQTAKGKAPDDCGYDVIVLVPGANI